MIGKGFGLGLGGGGDTESRKIVVDGRLRDRLRGKPPWIRSLWIAARCLLRFASCYPAARALVAGV